MSTETHMNKAVPSFFSFRALYFFMGCLPLFFILMVPVLFIAAFGAVEGYESNRKSESSFAVLYQEAGKKYGILWTLIQAYHEKDPSYTKDELAMTYHVAKEKVKKTIKSAKDRITSVVTNEPTKDTPKPTKTEDEKAIKTKIFTYAKVIYDQKIIHEKSLMNQPTKCMQNLNNPQITGSKNKLLEKYGSLSCAIYSLKKESWQQTNQIVSLANDYMFHPEKREEK